ncbi:hypothetical protein Ctaglu_48520 [Clostridium tagluense]|uniref:Transposase DDE domain-containing protein n=1 Tax=Clostridium tagluense TaxID=360422 RepID=A0A401UUI5_9CLOT|nr:hypothetical protein Ctaglu_48520 [Clostridium tagluense]
MKNLKLDGYIKLFANELKLCFSREEISNNTRIPSMWDKYFKRIRILDSTAFQVLESYKNIYPGSGGSSQSSGVKIYHK